MKQLSLFFLLLSFSGTVIAQPDSTYPVLIAKAGLFHLQKNYKNAIIYFEKAFGLEQPDMLNAYKAAGAWSLDSNTEKAFYYLGLSLKLGWTEADWLSFDPYFDYLRSSASGKWKQIEDNAFLKEKQYEQTLKLPVLRRQINLMALNDQRLRYKRIQVDNERERQIIDIEINQSDSLNLAKAKSIFKLYGWPQIKDIGKDGQNNLWLIVQHADQDVLFQQAVLAAMKNNIGTNKINLENYAFLYDRVQCNLNYKQYYGTQVNWTHNGEASGFRPIIKEDLVDKRRRQLGLSPLSIYALTYGFRYNNATATQARKKDSNDLVYAHILIDSATYFYKKKSFQKVYEFYNAASVILGGMTSVENYKAAIVFAKIAELTNEQQYKDIALDFLNLLLVRKKLTRTKLRKQPEFKVLVKEPRWVDVYKQLE